jgi:hypothetical protein
MSATAFVGPVKNVDAAREFAAGLKGERQAEWLASERRTGCKRERVFLAETPNGTMVMIYREAENAGNHLSQLKASSNPFDRHYIESISKMAGVDITSFPPGPPPHLVFEWMGGERARNCTMIAAPVPDPAKFWQFLREMSSRPAEHSESRQRHGIVFERAFYMHEAKMAVVYMEGKDPAASIGEIMQSTATYDKWFVEQLAKVHGMDPKAAPTKAPELLVLFDA